MSLLSRRTVLAAKIETTPGTAESLSGTDGAMNVFDATIQPTGEFLKRVGQGHFGQMAGYVGIESGTATFKTELMGDGSGGVPLWASTFFPAIGLTASAGVFTPKTEWVGANVKTVTIGVYENGVRKRIAGAMGTAKLVAEVGKAPMLEWTFMGRWLLPDDTEILAPTYPTRQPLKAKAGTLTIGSWTPCFSKIEFDFGNTVTPRTCITADGGLHSYIVTDRNVVGTMDPESTLVATNPLYTQWISSTELAMSLTISDATDEVTIAAPKVQWTNPQEADRSGIRIDNVAFQCNRDAGNDEISITFAAP